MPDLRFEPCGKLPDLADKSAHIPQPSAVDTSHQQPVILHEPIKGTLEIVAFPVEGVLAADVLESEADKGRYHVGTGPACAEVTMKQRPQIRKQ